MSMTIFFFGHTVWSIPLNFTDLAWSLSLKLFVGLKIWHELPTLLFWLFYGLYLIQANDLSFYISCYFKNQIWGMNRFCADCSELNPFS